MPLSPHRGGIVSDAFVWRLSVCLTSVWRLSDICLSVSRTSGLTGEQRGLGRLQLAEVAHVTRDSLGHDFQGQKVKGQLVADVLNSQHAGRGE